MTEENSILLSIHVVLIVVCYLIISRVDRKLSKNSYDWENVGIIFILSLIPIVNIAFTLISIFQIVKYKSPKPPKWL